MGRLTGGGIDGRTVPTGEDEEEEATEEGEAATEGAEAEAADRGKG